MVPMVCRECPKGTANLPATHHHNHDALVHQRRRLARRHADERKAALDRREKQAGAAALCDVVRGAKRARVATLPPVARRDRHNGARRHAAKRVWRRINLLHGIAE